MEVKHSCPPGYKQTEVGVIPEDWEVRQIGDFCEYQNGTSLEHLFSSDDGLKVISIGNYSVTGSYIDNGVYINRKHRKQVEKFLLKRNDLAMSLNDKTSVGAIIGRVLLIEQDDCFVFNQRTMRLRPRSNVSPTYLHHAINADRAHSSIVSLAKPGTQIYVNTDDVIELRLPLPPIPEQRAIATALSDMDALIESLEQLIAKKRDIKQGTMQQLLTGKKRLQKTTENGEGIVDNEGNPVLFSGEWERKSIGDVLTIAHGKSQHGVADRNGIYPILATGGQIGTANCFLYDKPSVLIGRKGTIDRPQYMDQPFWTVDTLFYSVIHKSNSAKYLFYQFCLIDWKQYNEASGVPSLNARTIERIELMVPPPEEQAAIAAVLSDMDTEIAELETRLAKTRSLKQGMMQELLTGKVRLV